MWAYVDATALIKRYLDELGRRQVQKLLLHHDCVTSALSPAEIRSGLRGRVSGGILDDARVPEVLERVAVDRAYWTLLAVGADVLREAEALTSAHPLSTTGAIHVASAKLFTARLSSPDLVFVSADERRTEAAKAIGLVSRHIG